MLSVIPGEREYSDSYPGIAFSLEGVVIAGVCLGPGSKSSGCRFESSGKTHTG